ncbi:adenylate cyclase type 9 [Euwallacea fornicatus]|uniref:adenylate cyclase type 9 n=1 Tax=Euwallacea fornicatus TaxID=995702 RepID=UPI00338F3025
MPSEVVNSVGYLKAEVIQDDHPSDIVDEEQVQLSLDPNFQVMLAQMSRESGCWGKFFPIPFERASQKSWWDPTFDSEILEDQYKKSAFPHYRFKLRYAIYYSICESVFWLIYLICQGFLIDFSRNLTLQVILFFILLLYNILVLFLTYTKLFREHIYSISLGYAICSATLSLLLLILSPRGQICLCIQLLILIYSLIPVKLYMALTLAILYSISFELLVSAIFRPASDAETVSKVSVVFVKMLSYVAIHLIGLHIYLMNNVRMRQTFMKVGQSLLVRKQLELEKRLKENMIHSLMPPSVANWLLNEDESFARRPSGESGNNDLRSLFRPFNMDTMNDVSILFADIVGFTKMSSTKSAEELVEILNNLFQRFDDLCKDHYCEKISTLGDCYYCVSGCPKARTDHAQCCVEMGLSMIQAIKQFDQEKHEGINMRVGIHTGTVLCGIVGTKRFKFDVWSNDVSLANKMESTGKPGMVHISEKTRTFLKDQYLLEDGDCVSGLKTYFILGRKTDNCPSYQGSFRSEGRQKYANSLQLFVSPPTSITSLSPHSRPRVLSCDTTHLNSPQNKNFLSPDSCIMKASSLPSILDSENEQDQPDSVTVESIKTPTSTASSGKYSIKLKNWKMPKFMRKTSTSSSKPDIDVDFVSGATDASEDGYQQVPAIIESITLNGKKKDSVTTLASRYEDCSMNKDTIDIKSYISHSRSDIGAFDYGPGVEFIRAGSYRGQYGKGDLSVLTRTGSSRSRRGRSPNPDGGVEPFERARSATVTVGNFQRPKRSFDVPSRLSSMAMLDEESCHSRKDSGIKSNSRKSSIQIDHRLLHQDRLQHRVSGYYTSSQISMNSIPVVPKLSTVPPHGPFFDKYGAGIQNLRKQSDRQLIKCVQDNSNSQGSYFIKPPLSRWTLFFKNEDMERDYRDKVHSFSHQEKAVDTLANSRFNTYVDICVSCFVFLIVSISLALVYEVTAIWWGTFVVCALLQLLNLGLCLVSVVRWTDRTCWCSRFFRWNFFGAILVSIPMLSAVINFAANFTLKLHQLHLFTYPLFVGLLHFCNFTQLNCWMKSSIATVLGVVFTVFFVANQCQHPLENSLVAAYNVTSVGDSSRCYYKNSNVVLNLAMLLILVWFLNKEFEIGYRLSYHANYVANRDKSYVQELKNQADYLIYNIVPEHVAEQLKKDAKYSENFKDVGIIFASIVNFNEMYDESFEGGREYLRVLNELIADFDELLYNKDEYKDTIEKIKTIGSTFMAASGLNSQMRSLQQDPNEHLCVLMDFAMDMQNVVERFNEDLLEFNLIIRIGYNFGDVTAAVIGNTKLYYDIWGDAVNIASRMDSTGVNGRIQVGEHCLSVLEKRFEFEHRGLVYVKGKDNMNVYLLKGRRQCEEETKQQLELPEK